MTIVSKVSDDSKLIEIDEQINQTDYSLRGNNLSIQYLSVKRDLENLQYRLNSVDRQLESLVHSYTL